MRIHRAFKDVVPLLTAAAIAGAPAMAPHAADDWPGKSVELVIPTRAGGGLDTTFRQMQPFLEEALGVPVAVEYRPGGQFAIGTTYVARNGDDCEPMMFHAIPDIIFSYLTRKVDYTYESFYPLAGMTTEPSTLWVRKDAPWQSLKEFVEDARKRPGEIRISVANLTNADHLAVLKLEEVAGIDVNIISYDGGGKARNAVVAGEVEGAMGGVFAGQKIASKARALGVFQPKNLWPELTNGAPAVNEVLGSDIPPIGGAFGFFVARACHENHPQRFEKLAAALRTASNSEGFAKRLDELGERSKLRYESPEQFDAFIRGEIESIKKQIEEDPALFGM
jgi:tripartite-type tricarboxylate transporter receptor subunit TctC